MCKVSAIVGVNDKNRHAAWLFMMELGERMSYGNNDGLGYAAFDKSGKIYGEKWLYNKSAFTDFSRIKNLNSAKTNAIYGFFGEKVLREEAQAIILHTRMATCGKGIQNTHPFANNEESPDVAIIHNGIIYNDDEFKKKTGTCDSEVLAHLYEEHKVSENLDNVVALTERLMGWYTVLSLSRMPDGRMIMDAYSDTGRLSSYFIEELGVRVYSTDKHDIMEIAKKFKYTIKEHHKMNAYTGMRIDVLTGEEIQFTTFKPKFKFVSGEIIDMSGTGNFDNDDFIANFLNRHRH